MLDGLSLDQIRTFIAAVDEGSFSAAGRKLHRSQSVVSELIANLEHQVGLPLFERSGRLPVLTPAGRALLTQARVIGADVDDMKAHARAMSRGLEPELAVVIDVLFPLNCLSAAVKAFAADFPAIPLKLRVDGLGAVLEPVVQRQCSFGIVGSLPAIPPEMKVERLTSIPMFMVAAAEHPLAQVKGPVGRKELSKHTQLVTTDRSALSAGSEFGVMSSRTWRLTDFHTKRIFLLDGLGFGGMPGHVVEDDIAAGRLVVLDLEDDPPGGMHLALSLIYPADDPPGLAGQRLIAALRDGLKDAGVALKSSQDA